MSDVGVLVAASVLRGGQRHSLVRLDLAVAALSHALDGAVELVRRKLKGTFALLLLAFEQPLDLRVQQLVLPQDYVRAVLAALGPRYRVLHKLVHGGKYNRAPEIESPAEVPVADRPVLCHIERDLLKHVVAAGRTELALRVLAHPNSLMKGEIRTRDRHGNGGRTV